MKMPMNWAKEFAEFECTPQEFADRMTMSGSKVETYECEADGIKNVVVGKILEIVPHPDSDHMVVCQVDVGRDAPVQIVTGANNLKMGDLVPAALHVAKLPGGKEIRRGKLRGVESGGMLCSLSELGLTTHDFPNAVEDGILVLDEATSSVDTLTEKAIQEAIGTVTQGRTSFVIAHRLSTVRDADVILVMRDGKVVERGSHRDLLAAHGYYYRLYTQQFVQESSDAAMKRSAGGADFNPEASIS